MPSENPIFEKPWYQSLTAKGLVVWFGVTAAIEQACAPGVAIISPELCQTLAGWTTAVGQILTVLGVYRKAGTNAPGSEPAGGA